MPQNIIQASKQAEQELATSVKKVASVQQENIKNKQRLDNIGQKEIGAQEKVSQINQHITPLEVCCNMGDALVKDIINYVFDGNMNDDDYNKLFDTIIDNCRDYFLNPFGDTERNKLKSEFSKRLKIFVEEKNILWGTAAWVVNIVTLFGKKHYLRPQIKESVDINGKQFHINARGDKNIFNEIGMYAKEVCETCGISLTTLSTLTPINTESSNSNSNSNSSSASVFNSHDYAMQSQQPSRQDLGKGEQLAATPSTPTNDKTKVGFFRGEKYKSGNTQRPVSTGDGKQEVDNNVGAQTASSPNIIR